MALGAEKLPLWRFRNVRLGVGILSGWSIWEKVLIYTPLPLGHVEFMVVWVEGKEGEKIET